MASRTPFMAPLRTSSQLLPQIHRDSTSDSATRDHGESAAPTPRPTTHPEHDRRKQSEGEQSVTEFHLFSSLSSQPRLTFFRIPKPRMHAIHTRKADGCSSAHSFDSIRCSIDESASSGVDTVPTPRRTSLCIVAQLSKMLHAQRKPPKRAF